MAVSTLQSPLGTLSGLARALVQQGRLKEADAGTLQAEAAASGVAFVTHLVKSKKIDALEVAEVASRTFGLPLLDLDAVNPRPATPGHTRQKIDAEAPCGGAAHPR